MSYRRISRPLNALTILLAVALLAGCQVLRPIEATEVSPAPFTLPSNQASSAASPSAAPRNTPSSAATAQVEPNATPSPAATEEPAVAATNAPDQTGGLATIESLSENLIPRRDPVSIAFEFGRTQSEERTVRTEPFDVQVGDKQQFNVSNVSTDENYTITATLVQILDNVLVYVEDGIEIDLDALKRDAQTFNDEIYPRNRELFGSEWSPGIDGDPRLTILNANIEGAGGYFSGSDEVPKSVNRFSNEREMFYINVASYPPGSEGYLSTLAHEFQHMIEYNEAERPTTWMNEGLSQLAEELNGFTDSVGSIGTAYVINPDLQLTDWGASPQESLPHYAASYLFMAYFYEQYGKELDLKQLIKSGAGERLEVWAELARKLNPTIEDFGDLYADWAIANLINDGRRGDGRYAYQALPERAVPEPLAGERDETVAQFGSDYWQIDAGNQERIIRFDGSDTIGVVDTEPEGTAMWWSNRGDNGESTLTRAFDLRSVSGATLQFKLWYDIEPNYDYGFVSVSTDGGQTFTPLAGRYTTTEDPQGANWGNGYTDVSGQGDTAEWVDEQIDLTPYVGKEIVLRFSVITDDAATRPGMVLDNIRIPEIQFTDDVETDAARWQGNGWTRTDNQLPQRWEVRLVRIAGNTVTFEPLELDANNQGEYRLAPNERGAVVVMATTPHTTERATYTLAIE